MEGKQYTHHDARGMRGPYTASRMEPGNTTWYRLEREGCDQPAYASARSLAQGLRPGLTGPVGWIPVEQS